jgi:hypothetical protein
VTRIVNPLFYYRFYPSIVHKRIKLVILRSRSSFSRSRKNINNQHVPNNVKNFKMDKGRIIRRSSLYTILEILKRRLVLLVPILIIYYIMLVIYPFFTIRLSILIPIPAFQPIPIIFFIFRTPRLVAVGLIAIYKIARRSFFSLFVRNVRYHTGK